MVGVCLLTIEKFAAKGELGGAMAVGHEAEVADAMETVGQRVKQETANELVGLELHDLCRAVLAVVLPGKGDVILVEGCEPAVGDCNAMGISVQPIAQTPDPARAQKRLAARLVLRRMRIDMD